MIDGRALLNVGTDVKNTTEAAAGSRSGGHGGRSSLLHAGRTAGHTIGTQRSDVARFTLTVLLVRDELRVRISLFAGVGAFELENVQNLRHNPVVW